MFHYLAGQVIGIGMGLIAGAFVPSLMRKIKALFVKETKAAEAAVLSKVASVNSDIAKKL